jgi:hypothetical protein
LPITQERGHSPRIFVISCHGVTFTDPDPSKLGVPATINPVKVDTFTTASFNHTVSTYTYNEKTCSFFGQAYTYFIPKILKGIQDASPSPPDKTALRDIITRSLCHTRDVEGPFVKDHCRFRCHKVGETMSDLYILGSGSPMNEVVLSIDLATGMEEDVHDKFGLREIRDRVLIQGSYDITPEYTRAILKAQRELEYLHTEMLRISQPPHTSDRMAKLRQLRTQYDNKYSYLRSTKNFLKGATQGPKYRYKTEYQSNYVNIGGNHMIKLSDVIQIAIENGTIHPETDFVIVQACRTFYGQLPSGYSDKSPGRGQDATPSVGGRKRTRTRTRTITSPRMKNRNNRNRNNRNKNNTKKRKRKTKTIRRT